MLIPNQLQWPFNYWNVKAIFEKDLLSDLSKSQQFNTFEILNYKDGNETFLPERMENRNRTLL